MRIKPRAGLKIRHPLTKLHISADGIDIQPDTFWTRRLADGDIVEVKEVQQTSAMDEVNEPEVAAEES